jgi:hypothetical protein
VAEADVLALARVARVAAQQALTTMKKLRIVILGFGTARQKRVLE